MVPMPAISHPFICPDCGSSGGSARSGVAAAAAAAVPWLGEGWEPGMQRVWTPGEATTV